MSRVVLSQIKSLTLFAGKSTKARRLSPIPQLTCIGDGCKYYQPEVIRCWNVGGDGTDVDWKCEADLPEKLRFGRVEVSCEGWDYPGDPFVLKGSCGLEYRLVLVRDLDSEPIWSTRRLGSYFTLENLPSTLFAILWGLFVAFMLYTVFKSCFFGERNTSTNGSGRRPPRPPRSTFPGSFSNTDSFNQAPPPYSDTPKNSSSDTRSGGGFWTGPGFWSGLGLGALAGRYFGNGPSRAMYPPPSAMPYDWECDSQPRTTWFSYPSQRPVRRFRDTDRGEGPSNLGSMRRSTGFGVSNVR